MQTLHFWETFWRVGMPHYGSEIVVWARVTKRWSDLVSISSPKPPTEHAWAIELPYKVKYSTYGATMVVCGRYHLVLTGLG